MHVDNGSSVLPGRKAPAGRRSRFTQLSERDRAVIGAMHHKRYSGAEIARALGKHRTTVNREITRNRTTLGIYSYYSAENADSYARRRRAAAKVRSRIIDSDLLIEQYIRQKLLAGLAPEQICGALRRSGSSWTFCWRTIYAWIERDRPGRKRLLPRCGIRKRRRDFEERYQPLFHTKHISERSRAANLRIEAGHWEIDCMHGTQDDSSHCFLVCVERMTRFLIIWKLNSLRSRYVCGVIALALRHFPVASITTDNGSEFALPLLVKRALGCEMYRSDPHHPEQRGAVENAIGRLRRDHPKGQSLLNVTQSDAQALANKHNRIPRKCLGFETPLNAMARVLGKMVSSTQLSSTQ